MLRKSSRTRIFNCVFHLKKTGQDPLNTSSLFIKIQSRIIIQPICTKTIEREQFFALLQKKGSLGSQHSQGVTHSDLIGWNALRLSLPRAILCKGTSCTDKGRGAHWAYCYSKDWLVKLMDAEQLLETSSRAGGSWRERALELAPQAFVPSPCNKFTFSSLFREVFSQTNPFLWNMMRVSMNRLEQDRP